MGRITRRRFIGQVAALPLAASEVFGAPLPDSPLPTSPLVETIWTSPANTYFAYPHANGFLPNGNLLLARQDGRNQFTYLTWNVLQGTSREFFSSNTTDMYWDADRAGTMYIVGARREVLAIDTASGKSRTLLKPALQSNQRLSGSVALTADGTRLCYAINTFESGQTQASITDFHETDTAAEQDQPLFTVPFHADHQQYSPVSSDWLGFAREGDIRGTADRVWAWRRSAAQPPAVIWDERGSQGGTLLAGHERWLFNEVAVLVVGYHTANAELAGLYLVDPARRAARLVSASETDDHCNVDRTGRWAVVDTNPPRGQAVEADGRQTSDVILVDMRSGTRQWLARSHRKDHPWHPHPHISPDGRYVVYEDYQREGAGAPSCTVVLGLKKPLR